MTGEQRTTMTVRRSGVGAVRAVMLLVVAAAVAVLLSGVAPTGAAAAPAPIIAPKKAKVIRSHLVSIRVRAGDRSQVLQAHLNGIPIGEDFGRTRKGVRRFKASASEGLRHGKTA